MEIQQKIRDRMLVLLFTGELDHHGVRNALRKIDMAIDAALPRTLTLDFSGVTFMDSSGIALILRLHRRMRDVGGRAWIENADNQPLRVLEASSIERIVNIQLTQEVKRA